MTQISSVSWNDTKFIDFKVVEYGKVDGPKGVKVEARSDLKKSILYYILDDSSFHGGVNYGKCSSYSLFDKEKGIYSTHPHSLCKVHVSVLLKPWQRDITLSSQEITKIAEDLLLSMDQSEDPKFEQDLSVIPFSNGNYDCQRKIFTPGFSPDANVSYRLPYEYTESSYCPTFVSLLEFMANGHEDRFNLLRAYAYTIIFSRTEYFNWMHLCGVSHGGKSQYTNTMICLVGEQVHTETSVKALTNDRFEIQHIEGMKLITLSESEDYTKDLEAVKRYTGNDTLIAARKHSNSRNVFRASARILMVGNYDLRVKDSGNAIRNRHLFIKCEQESKVKIPLCRKNEISKRWEGAIVNELPQIHAWIRSTDPDLVDNMMKGIMVSCPSQIDTYNLMLQDMNPILTFVNLWIDKGDNCYLGYNSKLDRKSETESRKRRTIYPAYREYCRRIGDTPFKVKTFTSQFEEALGQIGFKFIVDRSAAGKFYLGIKLKNGFYEADSTFGSQEDADNTVSKPPTIPEVLEGKIDPLVLDIEDGNTAWNNLSPGIKSFSTDTFRLWSKKRAEGVDEFMYERYMSLYLPTVFKKKVKKLIRELASDHSIVDAAMKQYMDLSPISSDEFKLGIINTLQNDRVKVANTGFLTYKYTQMGSSPRISPSESHGGPNQIKSSLRNQILTRTGDYIARNHDMVILDLDLKSCYTSVLLGLYPDEFPTVSKAVRGLGLWKAMEQEFINMGAGKTYHKGSVKVCVYASCFGGGNNAFTKGIIDKFMSSAGVRKKDIENTTWYEEIQQFANSIVAAVQTTDIISEFRDCAKAFNDDHKDQLVLSPTGMSEMYSEARIPKIYANHLQAFEIILMCETFWRLSVKHPTIEFLMHMHDGATLAVPLDIKEDVLNDLNIILEQVRQMLKLDFPQAFEVQGEYGVVKDRNWDLNVNFNF